MSAEQLKELVPFLRDPNPQVRQIALSNLLGHTPKGSPHRDIFFAGLRAGGLQRPKDTDVVRDLKLLCRDQLATAHDALRALINLSDSSLLAASLSEPSFLNFLVSYILNPQSILADLASMLLSNLTGSAATCATLLSMTVSIFPDPKSFTLYFPVQSRSGTCPAPVPYPSGEPRDIIALPLLIDAFMQGAAVDDAQDKDKRPRKADLHFLSSVFANISVIPAGRLFFLTPRPADPLKTDGALEYPLSKILAFTEHKDTIRRGGVASTLKNCAFHVQAHRALLAPDSTRIAIPPATLEAPGLDVLPYVLLPLAGPEEFDLEEQERLPPALQFLPPTKAREPDAVLRRTHVETLLLLCTTRWGRVRLRESGVYEVVRALHESEREDKVSEHVERLVNFLKREEAPEADADAEVLVEDAARDSGPTLALAGGSDDEDSRIEEI
ncbi:DUF383-domain-containing protein [Amylocystis lapponica]|nr:DUF383-domain-containing protein [Amylocystis lapponica]